MIVKNIKQIVFWMPLVMGVLLSAIIGYFALHSWGQGHGLLETLFDLALKVLPGILLAVEVALAWGKRWLGSASFLAFIIVSLLAAFLSWVGY